MNRKKVVRVVTQRLEGPDSRDKETRRRFYRDRRQEARDKRVSSGVNDGWTIFQT